VRVVWAVALAGATPSLLEGIEGGDYTAIGHLLSFAVGLVVVFRLRHVSKSMDISPESYAQIPLWEGVE
jgi:hypothetical protein